MPAGNLFDQQTIGLTRLPLPTRAQDEYKNEPGTVIAADFYGASRLLPLSGEWHVAHLEPHACPCAPEQHLGGSCWPVCALTLPQP